MRAGLSSYYDDARTVPWSFDRHLFGDHPSLSEVTEPVFLGTPDDLQGYDYMEGHWTFPTMRLAFDAADIVCIVREPRARLLSHYSFWRSWPEWMHELWEPYPGARYAQLRLSDYLSAPEIAHQADNLVTRLILGPHPLAPNDAHIQPGDISSVAAEAIERLDTMGYVDVLERGEAVHADLAEWFGSPISNERLNETDLDQGPDIDIDDFLDYRTAALLHDRTEADRMLWHHIAQQRGVAAPAARVLASSVFATSYGKIAAVHGHNARKLEFEQRLRARIGEELAETARVEHEAAIAAAEAVEADRLAELRAKPAAVRLIHLVRRGPRAIWQRVQAEIHKRRTS